MSGVKLTNDHRKCIRYDYCNLKINFVMRKLSIIFTLLLSFCWNANAATSLPVPYRFVNEFERLSIENVHVINQVTLASISAQNENCAEFAWGAADAIANEYESVSGKKLSAAGLYSANNALYEWCNSGYQGIVIGHNGVYAHISNLF